MQGLKCILIVWITSFAVLTLTGGSSSVLAALQLLCSIKHQLLSQKWFEMSVAKLTVAPVRKVHPITSSVCIIIPLKISSTLLQPTKVTLLLPALRHFLKKGTTSLQFSSSLTSLLTLWKSHTARILCNLADFWGLILRVKGGIGIHSKHHQMRKYYYQYYCWNVMKKEIDMNHYFSSFWYKEW